MHLLTSRLSRAYWISSNSEFFQYCDSNIRLFFVAPHLLSLFQLCDSFVKLWEAKQTRSHEPIYKTYTKIEAKGLRATTFAIDN